MYELNTEYLTLVEENTLYISPNIIDLFIPKRKDTRVNLQYDFNNEDPYNLLNYIVQKASALLTTNNILHDGNIWYMDIIQYNLFNNKNAASGLAWHCENDNKPDLITVLFYIRKDKTILNGNLRYKDKNNKKQILNIHTGTTVIMDGKVQHKPENCSGSIGSRDTIIVSFRRKY